MQGHGSLSRAPLQELYDPTVETSAANLDDLQRSWETLKNVVRYITRDVLGITGELKQNQTAPYPMPKHINLNWF